MALFGLKKKKKEEKVSTPAPAPKKTAIKKAPVAKAVKETKGNFSSTLIQPRITEKATMEAESGVYVFEVRNDATKKQIGSAVKHYYNVNPVKVNIVKIPSKKVSSRLRGHYGIKKGGKKAYVYLKKGDKIEII